MPKPSEKGCSFDKTLTAGDATDGVLGARVFWRAACAGVELVLRGIRGPAAFRLRHCELAGILSTYGRVLFDSECAQAVSAIN
ncbi:MAG: hypothetical protein ACR2L2_02515, partial [Acidobacteriota bacterium]